MLEQENMNEVEEFKPFVSYKHDDHIGIWVLAGIFQPSS